MLRCPLFDPLAMVAYYSVTSNTSIERQVNLNSNNNTLFPCHKTYRISSSPLYILVPRALVSFGHVVSETKERYLKPSGSGDENVLYTVHNEFRNSYQ